MLAFGIVSLAGLLIDFLCLVLAGSAISSEIVAGRWTLLRLTTLSSKSIVSAKHASVRLRYWPWLHVLAGMRCGVVVLLALWNLDTLRYSSALDVFLIIGLFILAAVPYVIEPFWRTQAMTSVGLFFSALNRSTALTVLTAVFGLFALWLVQAVIVGSVLFIELRAWISLYDNLPEVRSMWPTFIFTSLLIISFWLLNYGFYDQLERRSRRRILRRLAMSDV
ncbi:MAG: hypothetical protein KC547_04420 [Anaerolineae bacterium]|nr:hypothetical protein [Anaerolineae bacterium]